MLASLAHSTQPTIIAIEKRNQGRLATLDRILTILGSGHYLAEPGDPKNFYSHIGNSSTSMLWQTPMELLEVLYEALGPIDLDPCSPTPHRATASVKARVYYTEADDGLSLPWHGTVFLNPPYGRQLKEWVAKADAEVFCGNARMVAALLPARTDTRYWHQHVAGIATVFFLRGRLTFGSAGAAAPFPSAIALWGAADRQVAALEQRLPDAWVIPPAMPRTSALPPPVSLDVPIPRQETARERAGTCG